MRKLQGKNRNKNNTANLETMINQNEKIIKQNDETAIQDRAGTYIGYYRITC